MGENIEEIVEKTVVNAVENTIEEIQKPLDIQSESILGKIDEFVAEKVLPIIVKTVNDTIGTEVVPKLKINKGKRTTIKDWFQTPEASKSAILVFVVLVMWNIISNSYLFSGKAALWNICITTGSYFFIMSLKRKSGVDENGLFSTIKTIIDIVISNETNDNKIKRLESVLQMVARELGELYEDELDRITEYLKTKQE
jgi:hypothetical protein